MKTLIILLIVSALFSCKKESTTSETQDATLDVLRGGNEESWNTKRTLDDKAAPYFTAYQRWVASHKISYEKGETSPVFWALARTDPTSYMSSEQLAEHDQKQLTRIKQLACSNEPLKEIDMVLTLGLLANFFPERLERLKSYVVERKQNDERLARSIPGVCIARYDEKKTYGCYESEESANKKLQDFERYSRQDIENFYHTIDMLQELDAMSVVGLRSFPTGLTFDTRYATPQLISKFLFGTDNLNDLKKFEKERPELEKAIADIVAHIVTDRMIHQTVSHYSWDSVHFHKILFEAINGHTESIDRTATTRAMISGALTQVPFLPSMVVTSLMALATRSIEDSSSSVSKVALFAQYLVREAVIEQGVKCHL